MRRRLWIAMFLVLIPVLVTAQQPSPMQPLPPMPLDPLTPDEVRLAQRVTGEDSRLHEWAGGNGRLIYVQFISVKPASPQPQRSIEPSGRFAEVLIHVDPDGGGIRALVDLTAAHVIDAVRLPEQSVPIGQSDVELAAQIALDDPNLRRLLGNQADMFHFLKGPVTRESESGNLIEGLHTIGVGDDPCAKHRCVVLLFISNGRYLFQDQQITVDLSARKLMLITPPRPVQHQGGAH